MPKMRQALVEFEVSKTFNLGFLNFILPGQGYCSVIIYLV